MQISKDGWLLEARRLPTTHFNDRPEHTRISLVVIHFISLPPCHFGGPYVDELFLGTLDPNAHPYFRPLKDAELSTHLFINRQGQITQYVSFLKRAWHAGRSSYRGKKECNDYSIGIELEGCEYCAYTKEQYAVLQEVIAVLKSTYPEIGDNLAGHNEIAPLRKVDPGPYFNWKLFRNQAD